MELAGEGEEVAADVVARGVTWDPKERVVVALEWERGPWVYHLALRCRLVVEGRRNVTPSVRHVLPCHVIGGTHWKI
uniref:Uncharacterized protein n=1 Tax=Hyaloperonospora arabidopsidis (strain Emoy2) TaxID=559515 RepID=M4C1X2_HYAAE